MAVITNRPSKLLIDNLEYPGFISFTGNDSAIGEDGIVQFQATIEIGEHSGNPQVLNPRQNRFWCFGKKLEIWIMNDAKVWVLHPRGSVWLYQSFYDFQTRILNIQGGCLIYILKNRSTKDFEELEDLVAISENKKDPETGESITIEKEKYWWEKWNKPGVEDIDDVISEILQKLDLQKVGQARGKVRTPWQPSGSLLQSCGDLVFKSAAPSYLWCDNTGKIKVEKIPARLRSNNVAYTPGGNSATTPNWNFDTLPSYEENADLDVIIGGDYGDEINYKSYDSGQEPIKELVITGTWKIPDDTITDTDPQEGTTFKCTPYREYGSEILIDPENGSIDSIIVLAKGERCERISPGKKVVTEWREERKKLLFPNTRINGSKFIRMKESTITQKYDPENNDRLYSETEEVFETIGKVYSSWLQKNSNFIVSIDNVSTSYADALTHDGGLTFSYKTETTYDYAADLSLKQKTTTNYEPQAKILENYPIFSDDILIASQEIEKWEKGIGSSQSHWKISKICWHRISPQEIEDLENRLYADVLEREGVVEVAIIPTFKREGHFEESNIITPGSEEVPYPQVPAWERLALVTQKQPQILSNENLANPPATEYLANNSEDPTADNFIDSGGFILKKWRDSANCDYEPPREIIDLGEVFSESVLKAVGEIIYFLRQGRSQQMEVDLFLSSQLIDNYKPLLNVNVVEPTGEIIGFLADGLQFDVGGNQCIASFDGLWISTIGNAKPVTGAENEWIALG